LAITGDDVTPRRAPDSITASATAELVSRKPAINEQHLAWRATPPPPLRQHTNHTPRELARKLLPAKPSFYFQSRLTAISRRDVAMATNFVDPIHSSRDIRQMAAYDKKCKCCAGRTQTN